MRARAYVQMRAHMQYVDYKVDPYMRNEFDYKDGPRLYVCMHVCLYVDDMVCVYMCVCVCVSLCV